MYKLLQVLALFMGSLVLSQISEIDIIDREADTRYAQLSKQYRKTHPPERKAAANLIGENRRAGYKRVIATIQQDEPEVDFDSISTKYDTRPEFEPGGITSWRKLFANSFNTASVTGISGAITSDLSFIVNENGTATAVRATGGNEDFNLASVIAFYKISGQGTWQPAIYEGKTVKSRVRLPLKMIFE